MLFQVLPRTFTFIMAPPLLKLETPLIICHISVVKWMTVQPVVRNYESLLHGLMISVV